MVHYKRMTCPVLFQEGCIFCSCSETIRGNITGLTYHIYIKLWESIHKLTIRMSLLLTSARRQFLFLTYNQQICVSGTLFKQQVDGYGIANSWQDFTDLSALSNYTSIQTGLLNLSCAISVLQLFYTHKTSLLFLNIIQT